MDDVNDANERRRAIGHGSWATQDFNAIEIVQVHRSQRRIKGTSPGNPVDHEKESVKFFQSPKIRNGAGRPGISTGRDFHPGGQGKSAPQIADSARAELISVKNLYGRRNFLGLLGQAGGSDLHLLLETGNFRLLIRL